jgi:hypothetical protein
MVEKKPAVQALAADLLLNLFELSHELQFKP